MQNKLPLPIGASNYKLVSTEYYYVDKTLLIKWYYFRLHNQHKYHLS